MDNRDDHDGRMDPSGSGQRQRGDRFLPPINKRSRFKRQAPRRYRDTERNLETNRASTQPDERPQGEAAPSASQSQHLPYLTCTGIRPQNNVRQTASSSNRPSNSSNQTPLTLPPIDQQHRVPTPRPPKTPNNSSNVRSRRQTPVPQSPRPSPQHPHLSVVSLGQGLGLPESPPAQARSSRTTSRSSTAASREANSTSRNAASASRNVSRLGSNTSRISGLGSTSARSREDAPDCMKTSSGQPGSSTAPYQYQGSNSDGALMIKGIKKPTPPSGRVRNANNLRRHSTGGKMVPQFQKNNPGLVVLDESFMKPISEPPEESQNRPSSSKKQSSKTSLKQPSKTSLKQPSKTSLKSKGSSNHQDNISQAAEEEYPPDFHPLSDEEEKAASNSHAPSSRTTSRASSSKTTSRAPSSKATSRASSSVAGKSRPPSSIPEEIEGEGRYDYADEVFEADEDDEQLPSQSRISSMASIPEELPGQCKRYICQDDDTSPETDIPEEIVTSDDHTDDEDDDSRPMSRC